MVAITSSFKQFTKKDFVYHSYKEKIKLTLKVYLITLLLIFIISALILSIDEVLKKSFIHISLNNNFKTNQSKLSSTLGGYKYLIIILLAPLFEEIIFRLPLNFRVSSFALALSVILMRISGNSLFDLSNPYNYAERIFICIIFYLILTKTLSQNYFDKIKIKYSDIAFYISAISFAFLHIDNFRPFICTCKG